MATPAGDMKKIVARTVEWRIVFQSKRYQARPDRAESNHRRCDYFSVYATEDEGREVGHLTRKVCGDGIEWRGKIDGFDVQLYRNAKDCERESRECFDIFYAAHVTGRANNCEPHEHDEAIDGKAAA